MITYLLIGLGIIIFLCVISWYKIVPMGEAHIVVNGGGTFIASPDASISNKRTYFKIPSFIPVFGTIVKVMDMTIKEIALQQETFEINQARFIVTSSSKFRIVDVRIASQRGSSLEELKKQLEDIIKSTIRVITAKYDVVSVRNKKKEIQEQVQSEIVDDFKAYGLELTNFQLVDFEDTDQSKIISDISRRRETEISATTREQVAEKNRSARVKEAEAEELSQRREIERDQNIDKAKQEKLKIVAEAEALTKVKEYEVKNIQIKRQAEIDKEKAVIEANQRKEVEEVNKEQKRLVGEGDRLQKEEQAKGDASFIREKGFAEAEAKDKMQQSLNKFTPIAIQTLIAEKVVEATKDIGVKSAEALAKADMRIFVGGSADGQGFDIGKLIGSMNVSSEELSKAFLNRVARPNDMGLSTLFNKDGSIAVGIKEPEQKQDASEKKRN